MRTAHRTVLSTAPDGTLSVYRAASRKEWRVQTDAVYQAGHTQICASEIIEYRLPGLSFSRRRERHLRSTAPQGSG